MPDGITFGVCRRFQFVGGRDPLHRLEHRFYTVREHRLRPGQQVRGDHRGIRPGGVDRKFSGRETALAGVLAAADPVLDSGGRAVPGFQELDRPAGCVGAHGLVAVAISLLEGVQLSARDEAVRWANGVKYGLASSVWTSDHKRELRMAKRLDFSCVWINCHIRLVAEMPYGGFKQSGYGKDLSMYGSRTTPGSNTSLSKIDT